MNFFLPNKYEISTQKGRLRIHEILTAKGITAVCKDIA